MSSRELVIGADGFIGQRLQQITGADGTSRRNPFLQPNSYLLDLLSFKVDDLPEADTVWICAGVNGAKPCEGNHFSYRVNVDATTAISRHYGKSSAFVVWISSMTVEWAHTAYARQKAMAEMALLSMPHVAVVRAGRVTRDNLDGLCMTLIDAGRKRITGLHLWGSDEKAYEK